MRRTAPRRLGSALDGWLGDCAPPTLLARVQACWATAVGPGIAAEAAPVAERAGTLTVHCASAVWVAELELLAPDVVERLNAALDSPDGTAVTALRVRLAGRG